MDGGAALLRLLISGWVADLPAKPSKETSTSSRGKDRLDAEVRQRRRAIAEVEALKAKKNAASQEIATLKKSKQDASSQIEAMKSAGIVVSPNPAALGTTLKDLLKGH